MSRQERYHCLYCQRDTRLSRASDGTGYCTDCGLRYGQKPPAAWPAPPVTDDPRLGFFGRRIEAPEDGGLDGTLEAVLEMEAP